MTLTQLISSIALIILLGGSLAFLFIGDYITSIPKRWRHMRAYGASRRKALKVCVLKHPLRFIGFSLRLEPFTWRWGLNKLGNHSYYLHLGPLTLGVYR